MTEKTLPYGCWPSPISARDVAAAALRLGQPRRFDGACWWLETRPLEKGRAVLVRQRDGGTPEDIVPAPFSVQSRVNEYGGGAYTVHGETAYFVNKSDQDIWKVVPGAGPPQRITADTACKFADLVHDPVREILYCVIEQETHDSENRHQLGAIDLANGNIHVLRSGDDFYSSPTPSTDGSTLAWLTWSHPDMPWDSTRLWRAPLGDFQVGVAEPVAGGNDESIFQPGWLPDGRLAWVSDSSNWWNLYVESPDGATPLCTMQAEFGMPHWVYGMRSWQPLDANRIACAWTRDGCWSAGLLHLDDGRLTPLDLPVDTIDTLDAAAGHVVVLGGSATRFNTVFHHDGERLQELQTAGKVSPDKAAFSVPEAITFETTDGAVAHGFYYPPTHARAAAPTDARPPLLVKSHGGPTAATSPMLDMKIQYWTSRGFAVLDVNYRGSTGYGREYRRALYGSWGKADVEDCINGALHLADTGKADRSRLLISGSSAGGYTVLNALTFHDVFAAGASYYGVAEPVSCMRDTEKFESRYGDSLIGPLPESKATWDARSPLLHAERITCPVIFLQGTDDPVVPPDQSERMASALRNNGIPVAYLEFRGEGHGFRQATTIETALDSEYAFYCRILGMEPSVSLPDLHIDNID